MGSRQCVMKCNIQYENLGKLIQNEPFRYIKGMVYIHFIIYIYVKIGLIKKVKKNARTGQLWYSQLHLIKGRLVSWSTLLLISSGFDLWTPGSPSQLLCHNLTPKYRHFHFQFFYHLHQLLWCLVEMWVDFGE